MHLKIINDCYESTPLTLHASDDTHSAVYNWSVMPGCENKPIDTLPFPQEDSTTQDTHYTSSAVKLSFSVRFSSKLEHQTRPTLWSWNGNRSERKTSDALIRMATLSLSHTAVGRLWTGGGASLPKFPNSWWEKQINRLLLVQSKQPISFEDPFGAHAAVSNERERKISRRSKNIRPNSSSS